MTNRVIIIYHAVDFDGKCSAAIAAAAYEGATLYGWNHYWDIDWEMIRSHDIVIMVDIAFPEVEDMLYLKENFIFFWVDHHVESIKKHGTGFDGLVEVGKGACQLCWEFFYPHLELPSAVRYLADYDIWNHSDEHTLPFQYGMRYYDVKVDDIEMWKQLFSRDDKVLNMILDAGTMCFNFEETSNEYTAKSSFELEFQGHKCIALNSPPNSSLVFKSVGGSDYDIQIIFGYKDGLWKVTMYQDNGRVNVGEIATYFGGGGHEAAAGFKCSTEKMIHLGLIK